MPVEGCATNVEADRFAALQRFRGSAILRVAQRLEASRSSSTIRRPCPAGGGAGCRPATWRSGILGRNGPARTIANASRCVPEVGGDLGSKSRCASPRLETQAVELAGAHRGASEPATRLLPEAGPTMGSERQPPAASSLATVIVDRRGPALPRLGTTTRLAIGARPVCAFNARHDFSYPWIDVRLREIVPAWSLQLLRPRRSWAGFSPTRWCQRPHGKRGRDRAELFEHHYVANIACMNDEVRPPERLPAACGRRSPWIWE